MNITLTSLEALILKATHESLPCPDAAAVEAFCAILMDASDGSQLAAQTLAARIHTKNPREAMLTLAMLDHCMRRCDADFHAEVGKFRFLNEMIKLVSPKYFANRTAPEVRYKVIDLLNIWSKDYPRETKFKVAYDMLKNQGVVNENPQPAIPQEIVFPRNRAKNAIFEDEDKSKLLQKLLQSKKAEDLQHANRLIKTMVREEERRNEANSRRAQEVGAALDSAGLLREMLEHASEASKDEKQLIHELHASCVRMRPVLQRLAASDPQAENLNDILQASDALDKVFDKYNAFVNEIRLKSLSRTIKTEASNSDSLLDFAGANIGNEDNLSNNVKKNDIDELGDIFSTESVADNIAVPLKPVNLMSNEDVDLLGDKTSKTEGWNELDSLSEELLKQSLPDNAKRVDISFNSKTSKKIPMNALEKLSPQQEPQMLNNGAIFDLDFFTKKSEDEPKLTPPAPSPQHLPSNDDMMVDISTDTPNTSTNNNNADSPTVNILDLSSDNNAKCEDVVTSVENKETIITENEKKDSVRNTKVDVKPLTDINVTLQSVQPSKVPPLTAFEEEGGVTVVLHFCKDKPRDDVYVVVISTTSRCSLPIQDYKFQSVVPKGCKVRLLTPSGTSLPAYNPFMPPPALTQVMLIARPQSSPVINLKFVITYICDDDMCSEMGEVKSLPLDDI